MSAFAIQRLGHGEAMRRGHHVEGPGTFHRGQLKGVDPSTARLGSRDKREYWHISSDGLDLSGQWS